MGRTTGNRAPSYALTPTAPTRPHPVVAGGLVPRIPGEAAGARTADPADPRVRRPERSGTFAARSWRTGRQAAAATTPGSAEEEYVARPGQRRNGGRPAPRNQRRT